MSKEWNLRIRSTMELRARIMKAVKARGFETVSGYVKNLILVDLLKLGV